MADKKLVPLFSYGSNNPDQLAERLGYELPKNRIVKAFLPNYKLVFRGKSRTWKGGVASVEKSQGDKAYGYVAYVRPEDILTLDGFEGVPHSYKRFVAKVNANGKPAKAFIYVNNSKVDTRPSPKYVKAVLKTRRLFWKNLDDEALMEMSKEKYAAMFVYGTLMSGFHNNRLMLDSDAQFVGEAETKKKFSMSSSGGIPFVSKKPEMYNIKGEIWVVPQHNVEDIDRLEGHPNWYKRELVEFKFTKSPKIKINTNKAWLYFNQHNGKPHDTGDFREIMKKQTDDYFVDEDLPDYVDMDLIEKWATLTNINMDTDILEIYDGGDYVEVLLEDGREYHFISPFARYLIEEYAEDGLLQDPSAIDKIDDVYIVKIN